MIVHPCSKTRYETKSSAREHLIAIQRNVHEALAHARSGGKVPKRAYHCGVCDGWHLTSQDRQ